MAVEHEVIALNVEMILLHCIGVTLEVVLNHEGHVRKGQVNVVTKDNPVVRILIYSVAKIKSEFSILHVKIGELHLIAPKLTARCTAVDPVSLNNEETATLILESK